MDDENKLPGGSLSDVTTDAYNKIQDSVRNNITNPISNVYSGITNTDWSEVASGVKDNLYASGADFVNNAIGTVSENIDNAIKTGVNNVTGMVDNYVNNAVSRVTEKINNKFNSTFGKIEAKLRKGLFGKIDSWFGNPVLNSYKSIFGGLPGKLGSTLKGSFRNNPWINFYIDGNNYVDRPGLTGGTGGNTGAWDNAYGGINSAANHGGWANRANSTGGGVDGPAAAAWNHRYGGGGSNGYNNGRSTGDRPYGSNTYKTIPQRGDRSEHTNPGDMSLYSTAAFKDIAEHIKNTYGFTSNINEGMHLERSFVNRFGVTLIDNTLAHTRTHIFIGKPTCRVLDTKSGLVPEDLGKKDADLAMIINQDPSLYTQLNGRIPGATPFMTALQNRVVGISFQDATLSKAESAANIRGIRQEYPISFAESLVNVPITLTFAMDRNAEAFKLVNVWVTYMEKVKEGTLSQEYEDSMYNRMSYTAPIFVFVTEENNHDIIFWAKLVGNYPTSIPFSVFSNQGLVNREVREISVSFSSAMFKPFDAYALMEFNDMQKTANKQFWADYVPIADRKLEYYWTSGATVTLNDDTGKFRLNYYTSSGGTTATSSHSGGARNGGTAGGGGIASVAKAAYSAVRKYIGK